MLHQCVYRGIEHLGSLESTQKARVALGNSYASFVLSKLPRAQYLDILTLTHELIVNYTIARIEYSPIQIQQRERASYSH